MIVPCYQLAVLTWMLIRVSGRSCMQSTVGGSVVHGWQPASRQRPHNSHNAPVKSATNATYMYTQCRLPFLIRTIEFASPHPLHNAHSSYVNYTYTTRIQKLLAFDTIGSNLHPHTFKGELIFVHWRAIRIPVVPFS